MTKIHAVVKVTFISSLCKIKENREVSKSKSSMFFELLKIQNPENKMLNEYYYSWLHLGIHLTVSTETI